MKPQSQPHPKCDPHDPFDSPTFDAPLSIPVPVSARAASISPSGRDVALASRQGLFIIDLDNPFARPRHLVHRSPWEVADVQWSPFAARSSWVVSTSNQKALVWNLDMVTDRAPIEFTLHAHSRAITDINFSAHHPDILSTCAVDSYLHCWDLRTPARPVFSCADWNAGATQVKWNRQEPHIVASAHDRFVHVWDDRKGTFPVATIDAHRTKIYGIDWSRENRFEIITCSLDQTIKVWNFQSSPSEPIHVIQTDYPVWRARHTPFGDGIVAMPQRGCFQLQMFSQSDDSFTAGPDIPRAIFPGHSDQIQEFLWRSRGEADGDVDNREFQLVSLGADHRLVLHPVTAGDLETVNYHRGVSPAPSFRLTRQGAQYRSYATVELSAPTKARSILDVYSLDQLDACTDPDGRPGQQEPTTIPMITRINHSLKAKADGTRLPPLAPPPACLLQDEVDGVQSRFGEVKFHKINMRKRTVTFSLSCRWSRTHKAAWLTVKVRFPAMYPRVRAPEFDPKTVPSAMSTGALKKLQRDLETIAEYHRCLRVGSLEAIILFLLGRRTLLESVARTGPKLGGIEAMYEDGHCSDGDFDTSGAYPHRSKTQNKRQPTIDPPPARLCGARWTPDGQLVCFFARMAGSKPGDLSTLSTVHSRAELQPTGPDYVDEDESDSDESTCPSSTGSSDIDDLVDVNRKRLLTSHWRTDGVGSGPGAIGRSKPPQARQGRSFSVLAVYSFPGLLPGDKSLAKEYVTISDSSTVCKHNARVALEHGYVDISATWKLVGLVIQSQIPLEWFYNSDFQLDSDSASAQRQLLDDPDGFLSDAHAPFSSIVLGRNSLEGHPLSRPWVIAQLFDYFERLADVQTLAVLSCVLIASNLPIYGKDRRMDRSVEYAPSLQDDTGGQSHQHANMMPPPSPVSVASSPKFGTHPLAGPRSRFESPARSAQSGLRHSSFIDSPSTSRARQLRDSSGPGTPRGPSVNNSRAGTPSVIASPSVNRTATPTMSTGTATSSTVTWGGVHVFGENRIGGVGGRPPVPPLSFVSNDGTSGRVCSVASSVRSAALSTGSGRSVSTVRPGGADDATSIDADADADADADSTAEGLSGSGAAAPTGGRDDDSRASLSAGLDWWRRPVRVTMKNQERFDNGGLFGTSLLDHQLFHRAITYRDIYASMLAAWNLKQAVIDIQYFDASSSSSPAFS